MAEGNSVEGSGHPRQRKRPKKEEKAKKVSRTLSYLFIRNGLSEKGIPIQQDGYVNVDDVLDVFSDYTGEDIFKASESADFLQHRQCPQTGAEQIKMVDTVDAKVEAVSLKQPYMFDSDTKAARHKPQSATMVDTLDAKVEAVSLKQPHMYDSDTKAARHKPHSATKPADKRLSKFLSWLLRHGAKDEGFVLQSGGFLYIDEILKMPKMKGHTVAEIQIVVDTNDKQRFHLEPHPENGRLRIRANQGHSMQVADLQLQRITSPADYPIVLHGTSQRSWQSIKKQGLSRMKRTHIHFAPGEPGESGVISGMRGSCEILIFIDLSKALRDGLDFFLSSNNVILSPGDDDGVIHKKYFASVFQRSPRIPLKF